MLPPHRQELLYQASAPILAPSKAVQKLQLWTGTWNMGNSAPPEDLSAWLPKSGNYDLYAVGLQESKYAPRRGFSNSEKDFRNQMSNHLGNQYRLVSSCSMWEIRLFVYAKKELLPKISRVEISTEATGVGHLMGNKGGTCVAFQIENLSMCFVNTHLAAHQHKTERRNQDVAEVIGGLKLGRKSGGDILNQFHHVIWMGDLNYRLDYGVQGNFVLIHTNANYTAHKSS